MMYAFVISAQKFMYHRLKSMEMYRYQSGTCPQLQCESVIHEVTVIKMKTVCNFEVAPDNLNV